MYVLCATSWKECWLTHWNVGLVVSIDMLPDDVLLEIFDFVEAMEEDEGELSKMEAWQALVHVCRRWRSVVFGSPRRLELKLVCTTKTPARATLDVWPALPLVVEGHTKNVDNIIALLECSDRINQIYLRGSNWGDISEAMEVPFPELTDLWLRHLRNETMTEPVLPLSDSFLGGSAPRLRDLELDNVPFPGLPKLLSSATHLTKLYLGNIPHSGYISPEAMVTCLSLLTSLKTLILEFLSPQSCPDRESRRSPPSTRTVLPALTRFEFRGVCEYSEDLVARVDAPRLNFFETMFFNDIIFYTPQFTQFISRTPTMEAFDKATVILTYHHASIELSSNTFDGRRVRRLKVGISCGMRDWQVSFLEQVCTSSLPPLSVLENLYITNDRSLGDDIDNSSWMELHPFATVKNLYLSEEYAPRIVPALQELAAGRVTDVLPNLQNIFVAKLQPSGPVREGIGKFIAARQLAGHPTTVSRWSSSMTMV